MTSVRATAKPTAAQSVDQIAGSPRGVSICVPTHGGREPYVRDLLPTLAESASQLDEPVEIIVVDDPQGTLEQPCMQVGAKHLILPGGAGGKRNLAAGIARFDVLVFIDSDCLATPGLLREHVASLRAAPKDVVGVVGGVQMVGPVNRLWRLLRNSRLHNACFDFAQIYSRVAWGVGCNIAVYKHAFQRINGFHHAPYTRFGGEDVDFGIRITESAGAWITNPQALVLHRREPIMTSQQVLAKLFTYGRADVFLTSNHPSRRKRYPNPFALALAAAAVSAIVSRRSRSSRWQPGRTALATIVLSIAARLLPSNSSTTSLYGERLPQQSDPNVDDRRPNVSGLIFGACVDLAFDAGMVWECARRGRPVHALSCFDYVGEGFVRRREPQMDSH